MFSKRWATMADEELMQLIQKGHERALSELYNRYGKKLVRYFHRMLWKNEAKAQDFLHDLFLKIIEHPQQFDQGRKFSTWIYSSAFNMCKNEYRRQAFRQEAQTEQPITLMEVQPEFDQKEFQRVLELILKQSEESDRNLFILRYELDLSLAEIASTMDCPEGTVKSRLFYLKKKLALQLQAYNPAIN